MVCIILLTLFGVIPIGPGILLVFLNIMDS
jgi:hypothetical protein